jgi:hypothetical protein
VPPEGLVRVRLLFLKTNAGVYKLPPASRYALDRNCGESPQALAKILRNIRWRGNQLLPYMDDFMFTACSREATLLLRDRVEALLHRLGLQRNTNKGLWEPTQHGHKDHPLPRLTRIFSPGQHGSREGVGRP